MLLNPTDYDCKDIITLTRKELKALLVKLDRPESAKALCRLSETGVWYLIQAIEDTEHNNIKFHPKDEDNINNY